jgi:DNA (cytosine-5)-methyltransferase 1
MTHGSLFSGIGGFDLAAQWMGWDNLFHCEWNEFGQKVLNYYWPDAELFTDITKSDFTKYANRTDILSGGFPCQPYSHAGKRLGKEDERHLWPEMLRAIREIQPAWVVGENVSGLISWNGGLVFHEVQTDLEAEGYEVWPVVLPAAGVGAPHRRDRVWFIAYSEGARNRQKQRKDCQQPNRQFTYNGKNRPTPNTNGAKQGNYNRTNDGTKGKVRRHETGDVSGELCSNGPTTHPDGIRQPGKEHRQAKSGQHSQFSEGPMWYNFPAQPPVCSRNDGIPAKLDGITFSKWRNESIKAYGNAVVPQVVFQIFKTIEAYEQTNQTTVTLHGSP